jgi:Type ISP C-terminal specificity domain/N-6 DNA Methylase
MSAFKDYLRRLEMALKAGNATEHTHRPALKLLIESVRSGVVATNEPRRIACGAPDFIVTAKTTPLGYIEAKDVGTDLDRAEQSDQLKRYRASLRNLILTDYLEFRLYRNGELVQSVHIGKLLKNGSLRRDVDELPRLETLLNGFLDSDLPMIASPKDLAERMARLARLLRDLIRGVFAQESKAGDLHSQYEAFKKILISDLSVDHFSDMYAQTIAYGLFAARCNHVGTGFTREHAGRELPKTNPFLRRLFNTIAGADLDDRISWAVDDLTTLLAKADMAAILKDFGSATRQEDPVVHFYETFLAAYDPKLRELRGVYYTPEPVVGYIVRSVDALLKKEFKLSDGLANSGTVKLKRAKSKGKGEETYETHRVQILDPACGTGTFLHSVVGIISERFRGNAGLWPSYVEQHLLPRLYGFELLMAPYAVAHMNLGLQLKDSGYDFRADERLRVFLTNTLEEAHEMVGLPLFTQWLAEEAAAASEIKKNVPIMVVLGNPPYSGHSANKGGWITGLLDEYKKSPELRKPAQAKWLSDDYVKFLRFAQWRIEQTGHGILAFITNHSYLDNPTFLDMRRSLMKSFDEIYLLDLHGNSKRKESAPGGGKDENVFDIQQGVAIALFVKRSTRAETCNVRRADLWGDREHKYEWLSDHDVTNTKWTTITPKVAPWLFVKQDDGLIAEYQRGWSIVDAMNQHGEPVPGFATQHDEFAISFSKSEAIGKVKSLLETESEDEARGIFRLCAQSQWSYRRAKQELTEASAKADLVEIAYRPFDFRFTVYDRNVLTHRRERISPQLMKPNVALVIPKNAEAIGTAESQFFFCVDKPADLNLFRRGGAYLVPLWIYDDSETLFSRSAAGRKANVAPELLEELKTNLGAKVVTPERIFAYIYAVLHSKSYKKRYEQLLKRGFPRIPFTRRTKLFEDLSILGQKLVDLDLMRAFGTDEPDFPIAGKNRVDYVSYESRKVFINDDQYFEKIEVQVWDYQIGGYPVCEKYLKDRKGRQLTYAELSHYRRLVAAVRETLAIQKTIDGLLGSWPLQ